MKQTTLEDLYYGNINPDEICFLVAFGRQVLPSPSSLDVFIVDFLMWI